MYDYQKQVWVDKKGDIESCGHSHYEDTCAACRHHSPRLAKIRDEMKAGDKRRSQIIMVDDPFDGIY